MVIRSPAPPPTLGALSPLSILRALFRHRALIWSFSSRELLERHKGAVLGVAWNVLSPLLQLGVYTAIFGYVFGTRWERGNLPPHIDFPLVFFAGHTLFHVFAESANRAPTLISGRSNLVRKVVFPLEILPVTVVLSSLVYALISTAIMLAILLAFTGSVPWTAVLMPLVYLPLVMLAAGMGWMLSAAGVFLRDVRHIVQVLTQLLMFATPLFYKLDRLPADKRWIGTLIELNPMTTIVESGRRLMLWGEMPDWSRLAMETLFAAIIMQLGWLVFAKLRPMMADVH